MRAVIQRVSKASVRIKNLVRSEIGTGLLVLAGIEESDNDDDIEWLCNKIVQLRIFNDSNDVMNLSVIEYRWKYSRSKSVHTFCQNKKGQQTVLYPCSLSGDSNTSV